MVKRIVQRRKPSSDTSGAITLTPELVQNARDVVSLYDGVDWEQLHKVDCDTVHLHFQSAESAEAASHIMLEMAAGELGLRNTLISRIRMAFQEPADAGGSGEKGGKDSVRRSYRPADKLLADLVAERNSRRFADLHRQASLLYQDFSVAMRKKQLRKTKSSAERIPTPSPRTAGIPFWLGATGDRWISVPTRLAFAEPIVGLCRRIAENNTGDTTLGFEPGEEDSLRLHHRLWTEFKPRSYRVPSDDFSHPLCHKLQSSLDVFLPKVRATVCAYLDQGKTTELSAIAENPTTLIVEESQTKTDEQTQPGKEETVPALQSAALLHNKTDGTQSATKKDRACVRIMIHASRSVYVNGKHVKHTGPANTFLALAALACNGAKELEINTRPFVELSHGKNARNIANKWGKNKAHLVSAHEK